MGIYLMSMLVVTVMANVKLGERGSGRALGI